MTATSAAERVHPPNTSAERTRLSWTRTTLALVAFGIGLIRLLWQHSPVVGACLMTVALCAGGALAVRDAWRGSTGPAPGHDGLVVAAVAGGTCALGCAALVLVLLR